MERMSTHHRISYIELAATDVARAKQFYANAFSWAFNDYGPDYAGIQGATPDDPEVGGLNPQGTPSREGALILLFSSDLDASVEAVRAAGGEIVDEPFEFPGGRRFHFTDPSGNRLGVFAEA
jgi:predicted enzyme related to lactoylglutathione lyase